MLGFSSSRQSCSIWLFSSLVLYSTPCQGTMQLPVSSCSYPGTTVFQEVNKFHVKGAMSNFS